MSETGPIFFHLRPSVPVGAMCAVGVAIRCAAVARPVSGLSELEPLASSAGARPAMWNTSCCGRDGLLDAKGRRGSENDGQTLEGTAMPAGCAGL